MNAVRDYRASDLDAVIDLFRRSVHEVARRDYSPAQLAAWAPDRPDREAWAARLRSGGVFVCERNGDVVGFTRIDEAGDIDLLYVHPQFQNQGIAGALMEQAVGWASLRGVRRLTSDVSLTARAFFEGTGFQVVRSQEVERRGIVFQNFCMERDIDSEPSAAANTVSPRRSA
jgi:putative acetyltransferase